MSFYRCPARPKAWLTGLVFGAFSGAGLAGESSPENPPNFEPVDCIVTPFQTIDLSSPVRGVLQRMLVDRSDRVLAGQVIAELRADVERVELDIALTRARMRSEVRLWETSVEFDSMNRDRLEALSVGHAVSATERDQARRDVELSSWRLHRERDLYQLRQVELRRAQTVMEQKTIRSPVDGVVVRRFKSVGEYVEEQPVVRIAQLDPLHVEAIVPMTYFGRIREGTFASVVTEQDPETTHRAKINAVDRMGDAASGTFGVRLEIPNPDYRIPAGLKCLVKFSPALRVAAADIDRDALASSRRAGRFTSTSGNRSVQALPVRASVAVADAESGQLALGSVEAGPVSDGAILRDKPAGGSPFTPANFVAALADAVDTCRALGPIADRTEVDRLMDVLTASGLSSTRRESTVTERLGFIVLSSSEVSESVGALSARLRQAGVDSLFGDLQRVPTMAASPMVSTPGNAMPSTANEPSPTRGSTVTFSNGPARARIGG